MTTEEIKVQVEHLTNTTKNLLLTSNGMISATRMFLQDEGEVAKKDIERVMAVLQRTLKDIEENNNQIIELNKQLY